MEIKRSRYLMPLPLIFADEMIVTELISEEYMHLSFMSLNMHARSWTLYACLVFASPYPHSPELCLWIPAHSRARYFLCEKTSMASESSQVYPTHQWSQSRNLFCSFSWIHLSLGLQGPFQRKLKELSEFCQERQKTSKACPCSRFGSSLNPLWICSCFSAAEDFLKFLVTTGGHSQIPVHT